MTDIRSYCTLIFVVLFSTLLVWIPFMLRAPSWAGVRIPNSDLKYVYGSFDGPLYIIPAKTLYDKDKIDIPGKGLIISLPIRPEYFAAHLPMYPLLIRAFSWLGYTRALLLVNVFATMAAACIFYYVLRRLKLSEKPLMLTLVFLFLPRFLIVRSTGAPESLFIAFIMLSLLFFSEKKYVLAGVFGALATATKTPGILLILAYGLVFLESYVANSHEHRQVRHTIGPSVFSLLLIPLSLVLVFFLYKVQLRDFFAYFHTNGVVPMPYPFSAFNFQAFWVGTAWLEDIVLYFFIYTLVVITLFKHTHRGFFYFSLVFLVAASFVQHRDIARYTLPLWPLACIAFERFFTSKKFLIAALIVLPAIYLYTWNFLVYNIMPIGDWSPFL